jgi:hypothetical protein
LYQQVENVVSEEFKNLVKQELLDSTAFPWYLMNKTLPDQDDPNDHPYLSHVLMHRNGDNTEGTINSMLIQEFLPIFASVTEQLGMDVKHIMRANINLTWHNPWQHGAPHRDHECDHHNMIIYLNEFTQGGTYIFDDNNQILDCAPAIPYGATVFGGGKHAQGFCAPGELRLIAVFTFQTH